MKERIELVHVNQAGAAPYALAAAGLLKIPVVLHSRWHEDAEAVDSWRRGRNRLRAIVCVSEFQKKLLLNDLRSHRDKLVVVRDPYRLRPGFDAARSPVPGRPVFVCPARFHPHKRQDLLVRAVAHYVTQYGSCLVEFVGEESQGSGYLESLRSAVRELGIEDNVAFLGYRHDVLERLERAAAMVLPSDRDAFPRVMFDTWEARTISIAWAGSGGPAETIGESSGGILYAEQTPEALAAAMHDAATLDPVRRSAMIANGVSWLQQHCAPERHAAAIVEVWMQALGHRPGKTTKSA